MSAARARFALLSLALLALLVAPLAAKEPAQPKTDPLQAMNGLFRAAYSEARGEALASAEPYVLAGGDSLVLFAGGERIEGAAVAPQYHQLKAVAHAPLVLFVMLASAGEGEFTNQRRQNLQNLHDAIGRADKYLAELELSDVQFHRQKLIFALLSEHIVEILKAGRTSPAESKALLAKLRPLIDENVREAAALRIDSYYRQMLDWRSELSDGQWKRLRVVVAGAAMPRRGHLTVQFFARLLGERGEGKRIVYAESRFAEQQALDLLGTHVLDSQAAVAFFDDPQRLHRDLLADAATEYLKELDWSAFEGK